MVIIVKIIIRVIIIAYLSRLISLVKYTFLICIIEELKVDVCLGVVLNQVFKFAERCFFSENVWKLIAN